LGNFRRSVIRRSVIRRSVIRRSVIRRSVIRRSVIRRLLGVSARDLLSCIVVPVTCNRYSYSLSLFIRQYLLLFVSCYSLFDYLLHSHLSFVLIVVREEKKQF
jgi:hypothetical protein